jgi:hypothetical protein
VTPQTAAALERVAAALRAAGIPFLLGGSGLLHALGLDVRVGDVDLVLRAGDREAVEALPWWRSTTTAPTELMRSAWKARLLLDGVEVDAIGGMAWRAVDGGPVVEMPFRAEGEWRGVPLAPAAHWLLLYEAYKPETAAALAAIVAPEAVAAARAELGLA